MSETPTYTFQHRANSYFLGKDLRVTRNPSGRTISLNVKEGKWAVNVKDSNIYGDMSTEAQKAADTIGEDRTQALYDNARDDFWNWAGEAARDLGFSDVFGAGRSGGWMAVEDTSHYDLAILLDPANCGDEDEVADATDVRARFLTLAFAVTDAIDKVYRPEFEQALIEEAAKPATTQIMVLPDGKTFGPLDGCRIFEVEKRCDTEEIEELLEQDPEVLPCLRLFRGDES